MTEFSQKLLLRNGKKEVRIAKKKEEEASNDVFRAFTCWESSKLKHLGHLVNLVGFPSLSVRVTHGFIFITARKDPLLTPFRLETSQRKDERERAPPCGEATAVRLNARLRERETPP